MATTVTIREGYDSWVSSGAPTTRHPTDARLRVVGTTSYGYIYFPLGPELRGKTILSATLYLYGRDAGWTSQTVTMNPITVGWDAGTLTWNNKPAVSATAASLTLTNTLDQTEWAIPVTTLVSEFAAGTRWRGMRLSIDGTVTRKFNSLNADRKRPRLVVTWASAPAAPVDLSPSGGRAVSVSRPVLSWSTENNPEGTSVNGFEVQVDPAANGTTPAFASGTVTSDLGEYNLAMSAYAGLAAAGTTQWRLRVRDADAGLWSLWSDWSTFTRVDKGTVTITTPTEAVTLINRMPNPSFEVDTTGWLNQANVTLARSTAQAAVGAGSLSMTAVAAANMVARSTNATDSIPCVPGQVWSAQARYRAAVTPRSVQLQFRFFAADQTVLSDATAVSGADTTTGWTTVKTENVAVPTGAAFITVQARIVTPAAGEVHYLDAVQAELGPVCTAYGDGTTAGWGWSGTAHLSPSGPMATAVVEYTPPVAWTTSFTQSAWRVRVLDADALVLHDSGRKTGTSQDYTLPARDPVSGRRVLIDGRDYRLQVWAWDAVDREATPGDPAYASAAVVFNYADDPTPNQVTALTAAIVGITPYVDLAWSRTTTPDSWTLLDNDKVVETGINGADWLVTGTSYAYRYKDARPGAHVFKVKPTVNNLTAGSPTVALTTAPAGVWVIGKDVDSADVDVMVTGKEFGDFSMPDRGTTFTLPQARTPVRVTQGVNGWQGSISGRLASTGGQTTETWRDRLLKLKRRGDPVTLFVGGEVIRAVIFDINVDPSRDGGQTRNVSFGFFQVGALDWLDV